MSEFELSRDENVPSLTADRLIDGRWLSLESVAIFLGVRQKRLSAMLRRKGFPGCIEYNGELVWDISQVAEWSRRLPPPRPVKQATCLYRHFDVRGRLLYVGISLSVATRTLQHKCGSLWFRKVSNITLEWFPTREAAECAERKAIAEEKPRHNQQGVQS